MKMPSIVGIFIITSRENVMLSWVEQEKFFITLGPDLHCLSLILQFLNSSADCEIDLFQFKDKYVKYPVVKLSVFRVNML